MMYFNQFMTEMCKLFAVASMILHFVHFNAQSVKILLKQMSS